MAVEDERLLFGVFHSRDQVIVMRGRELVGEAHRSGQHTACSLYQLGARDEPTAGAMLQPEQLVELLEIAFDADNKAFALGDHRHAPHPQRAYCLPGVRVGQCIDGIELDAARLQVTFYPDAVGSARQPIQFEPFGLQWRGARRRICNRPPP